VSLVYQHPLLAAALVWAVIRSLALPLVLVCILLPSFLTVESAIPLVPLVLDLQMTTASLVPVQASLGPQHLFLVFVVAWLVIMKLIWQLVLVCNEFSLRSPGKLAKHLVRLAVLVEAPTASRVPVQASLVYQHPLLVPVLAFLGITILVLPLALVCLLLIPFSHTLSLSPFLCHLQCSRK
jgi:hypothetical protein